MRKNSERHLARALPLLGSMLVAGAAVLPGSASAADLGGNCCADLEERIAELEATTARKGNRKVSLEISGWVTQQLMAWDDGEESNVYVVDTLTDVGSQFSLKGKAQISADVSAGYTLMIDTQTDNGFLVNQNADDTAQTVGVLQSYWYLQSNRFGKVAVGLQSHATDNINVLDLSGVGSLFAANVVSFDGAGMFLRPDDGVGLASARWLSIGHCLTIGAGIFADCHGNRSNSVRYDTPVWNGFQASTSWGEDDFWDAALRYNGDIGPIKVAFGAGYVENRDGTRAGTPDVTPDTNSYQVGASLMHTASGLFYNVSWGEEFPQDAAFADTQQIYMKAGWRTKFLPLGATVFYGEWGRDRDMFGGVGSPCSAFFAAGGSLGGSCANAADATVSITGSNFERWGLGVVQEIDAAAMAVWAKYKQHEGDIDFDDAGVAGNQDLEDLQMFLVGGAIFF